MKKNKIKVLGLIPTRLNSRRLPAKSLLPINNIPIHMFTEEQSLPKKSMMLLFAVMIKIFKEAKKYGAKAIMTSRHHVNGTERICEA